MLQFSIHRLTFNNLFCAVICLTLCIGASDNLFAQKPARGAKQTGRTARKPLSPKLNSSAKLSKKGAGLVRADRLSEAERVLERAADIAPENEDPPNLLGVVHDKREDYDEAEKSYRQSLELNPQSVPTLNNLGILLTNRNQYQQALETFQKALQLDPNHQAATVNLGLLYAKLGDYKQSAALLSRHRNNLSANANLTVGDELRDKQKLTEAVEFYRRSFEQNSSRLVTYIRLGVTLMRVKQFDEALTVLQQAAEKFPDKPEAHYFTGMAAREKQNFQVAEAAFRRALELRPDDVDTLAQLGFVVGERGNTAEAETFLRRALELDAQHFFAAYDLAGLLIKTQRAEQALTLLQTAAKVRPDDPNVYYQLHLAYTQLNRPQEAEQALAQSKQLETNN